MTSTIITTRNSNAATWKKFKPLPVGAPLRRRTAARQRRRHNWNIAVRLNSSMATSPIASALDEIFSSVKFDQVIHLAARAGVRPSLADPALYQRVNVEGTVNVLEAARTHRVKKITIASSSSVYGMNSKTPFSESDPIFSAVSPYAASKLACEALGHVWHHIYGMDVAMLRFFTVYGPRQRPDLVIYKFAKLISAGKPIPVFGDGSAARDYTYITDTLDGIIACTQKEFGYELFNLGESQTVKLN